MIGKRELEMLTGTCKHFTGVGPGTCRAGCDYTQFTSSLPCLKRFDKGEPACEKRQWITPEEAQAEHAEMEAFHERTKAVMPMLKEAKKTRRSVKDFPCPACLTGLINIRVEPNGHARVYCSTEGCARWIE